MEEEDSTTMIPSASPEPLLPPVRPSPARQNRLASLLNRAAGRRGPSTLVRETAALQLEQRRAHWSYSRPVVALDMAWNLAFFAVSAAVLASTAHEQPNTPVRLWIVGYALQCLVHVGLVWVEYGRRRRMRRVEVEEGRGEEAAEEEEDRSRRIAKRCESVNTMLCFLWWMIGFYLVVTGGEKLMQHAPRLYWLAVVFLAFDVFFAIFCLALACVIGIALCCCLPCIIAILYAVAGQEGASDADICILPRYRYTESSEDEQKMTNEGLMIPILNNSGTSTSERILLHEDAECSICLTSYEDGVELHSLPCNHHFHSTCIVKWLRINATCPLCKYNILKGSDNSLNNSSPT
ncbi:E3 ubiquitin protein ligase RIE1-like isoform X1 [Typha angustifolia]|uniref:E3 ubiquitin protein ligase RIE1-like isoform X1 n=1 Tax=Typha angustifolia TaxID=59011 RepID=UPI003C2C2E4B